MKSFKHLAILLTITIMALKGFAQEKSNLSIRAGVGLYSFSTLSFPKDEWSEIHNFYSNGTIYAEIFVPINRVMEYGIMLSKEVIHPEGLDSSYKINKKMAQFGLKWNYYESKYINLYSTLYSGLLLQDENMPNVTNNKDLKYAFQVILGAIEIKFLKNNSVFLEMGAGNKGVVNFGTAYYM